MRIVDEIHYLVTKRNFKPCIAMRYDREAYADKDPESDLRVTSTRESRIVSTTSRLRQTIANSLNTCCPRDTRSWK
jgi:hypothetical protein